MGVRVSFPTTEDDAPTFIKTMGLERTNDGNVAIFATNKRGADYVHLEIPADDFVRALRSLRIL